MIGRWKLSIENLLSLVNISHIQLQIKWIPIWETLSQILANLDQYIFWNISIHDWITQRLNLYPLQGKHQEIEEKNKSEAQVWKSLLKTKQTTQTKWLSTAKES